MYESLIAGFWVWGPIWNPRIRRGAVRRCSAFQMHNQELCFRAPANEARIGVLFVAANGFIRFSIVSGPESYRDSITFCSRECFFRMSSAKVSKMHVSVLTFAYFT